MRTRLVAAVVVAAALILSETAASRQGSLMSRDGQVLAYGDPGDRSPARPGLSSIVELMDRELPPDARVTSLDDHLQRAAETALGNRPGVLVALDPRTGEVLTYAVNPDPQQPAIGSTDPRPPGSTFKLVTAAAALESGRFTPSSRIACPQRLMLDGRTIRTFTGAAPEGLTLSDALARSCNTAFAGLGRSLGAEPILRTARALGLEVTSDRQSTASHVRQPSSPTEAASLGAGISNVRMTPASLAAVAGTIGNGGKLIRPRYVGGPVSREKAIEEGTSEQLVAMMERVVEEGTGHRARLPGVVIAGKTGTVDRALPSGDVADDAWFVALAPSRDPRLVVVVMLPRAGFGADRAAPLARRFLGDTRDRWDRTRSDERG